MYRTSLLICFILLFVSETRSAALSGPEVGTPEFARAVRVPSDESFDDVILDVKDEKIVYVGEHHDRLSHHLNQLRIIKELYARNKKLAIGMEMFQIPFQEALDRYIAGETDEKRFLEESEYYERWGFEYDLYRPIVDFARENKIPIVALRIETEIVKKVWRSGLDSLTAYERQRIPSGMDLSDKDYRNRLKNLFGDHPSSGERNFEYFYQSQILWDEAMAQAVHRFLRENPGYQMVVLAGSGHLRYGSGIPKRAYRRNGYDYAIILNDEEVKRGIADYILFTEESGRQKPARLGVFLDESKGGLKILGFTKNSAAERAGLREKDVIVLFGGESVRSVDELKGFLRERGRGDRVEVLVLRNGKEKSLDVRL